jgi:hypothetical protein
MREVIAHSTIRRTILDEINEIRSLVSPGGWVSLPHPTIQSILDGVVPASWLRDAWPTTRRNLLSFVGEICRRLQHLLSWEEVPKIIDLSTFSDPARLLLAIRQEFAQASSLELENVALEFQVAPSHDLDSVGAPPPAPRITKGSLGRQTLAAVKEQADAEAPTDATPSDDSYFLQGIFVEGADWSVEKGTLTEAWLVPAAARLHAQVPDLNNWNFCAHGVCPMPPLKATAYNTRDSYRGVQHTIGPLAPYFCPLFQTPCRNPEQQICTIPLRSSEEISNPSHWALRGVALVLEEHG